jgi:sarcosine oxidase
MRALRPSTARLPSPILASTRGGLHSCDVIVLGLGGMGSAALYHLARQPLRVVGIEQHALGHCLGSSGSESRGFRKAYHVHPTYVALARRAQALWRELESEAGERLLDMCGALLVGARAHPAVAGMLASVSEHGLPYEVLDAAESVRRYPALKVTGDEVTVIEREAGLLLAERCNAAHLKGALARGARVHAHERTVDIDMSDTGVRVRTNHDIYSAGALVVAAGPWLLELGGAQREPRGLLGLELPLVVERQAELWFEARNADMVTPERLPLFHFADAAGAHYGIPDLGSGVKACRHHGGAHTSPSSIDRTLRREDEEDVRGFLAARVPAANGKLCHAKICMNTNTPDRNFVLGAHPACPRVILAGGFSGHGYKFAPVVGEIVAELVTTGVTRHDIRPFEPSRFT